MASVNVGHLHGAAALRGQQQRQRAGNAPQIQHCRVPRRGGHCHHYGLQGRRGELPVKYFKSRQMTFFLRYLKQTCGRRFKKLLSPPVSNPYQGLALNRFQLCRKFLAYASIFFYFVLFFERFCTFI